MRIRLIALLAVLTALAPAPAPAQETTGSISGTITDPSGAAIRGATVTLTNTDRNHVERTLKTTTAGFFTANSLPLGTYSVQLTDSGFKSETVTTLVLHANDALTVNRSLVPGSETENVTVTADAAQLNLENATSSGLISGDQLNELVLNNRNYEQFLQLQPGVAYGGATDQLYVGSTAPSGASNTRSTSPSTAAAPPPTTGPSTVPTTSTAAPTSRFSPIPPSTPSPKSRPCAANTPHSSAAAPPARSTSSPNPEPTRSTAPPTSSSATTSSTPTHTATSSTSPSRRAPTTATTTSAEPSAAPSSSPTSTTAATRPFSSSPMKPAASSNTPPAPPSSPPPQSCLGDFSNAYYAPTGSTIASATGPVAVCTAFNPTNGTCTAYGSKVTTFSPTAAGIPQGHLLPAPRPALRRRYRRRPRPSLPSVHRSERLQQQPDPRPHRPERRAKAQRLLSLPPRHLPHHLRYRHLLRPAPPRPFHHHHAQPRHRAARARHLHLHPHPARRHRLRPLHQQHQHRARRGLHHRAVH